MALLSIDSLISIIIWLSHYPLLYANHQHCSIRSLLYNSVTQLPYTVSPVFFNLRLVAYINWDQPVVFFWFVTLDLLIIRNSKLGRLSHREQSCDFFATVRWFLHRNWSRVSIFYRQYGFRTHNQRILCALIYLNFY